MTDPRTLARTTDPETSHVAAAKAATKAGTVRANVYNILLTSGPLTHDAVIFFYRATHGHRTTDSSIRTRVSELVQQGAVEQAGHELNSRGNRATVWRAVPVQNARTTDQTEGDA